MEILACPKCQEPDYKSAVNKGIYAKNVIIFTVNKIGKR
jgi:uncharacterized protein YbaR (Trm112 family)